MRLAVLLARLILAASLVFSVAGAAFARQEDPGCGSTPAVSELLLATSLERWTGWVAGLSGASGVWLNGRYRTIQTRYSYSLFDGTQPYGYDFVKAQLLAWYPSAWLEEDSYPVSGLVWKNLVLTIPGRSLPQESVLLTAHLDSITSFNPSQLAPGAEDNASGSAALLEAAYLFRERPFERTVRLIWFTGEEQGLYGSKAYVQDHSLQGIVAVFNLDMFGYDHDNDRCFELHVGTRAASQPVGACFMQAITSNGLNLKVDYLNGYNMTFSDHASFWNKGVGAVEVLENSFYNDAAQGCGGVIDENPNYHTPDDTIRNMNLPSGFEIVRAALAAVSARAGMGQACLDSQPALDVDATAPRPVLAWVPHTAGSQYILFRAEGGCNADLREFARSTASTWTDETALPGRLYGYRIAAVAPGGACFSPLSTCVTVRVPSKDVFIPVVTRQ